MERNKTIKIFIASLGYIWHATHMGGSVVKDAPGLAFFQIYNLVTHD